MAPAGSGRLRSLVALDFNDNGPILHETMHTWGAFVAPKASHPATDPVRLNGVLLRGFGLTYDGHETFTTVSIGVAIIQDPREDLSSLLAKADIQAELNQTDSAIQTLQTAFTNATACFDSLSSWASKSTSLQARSSTSSRSRNAAGSRCGTVANVQ